MFVERIGTGSVIAHRIQIAHFETAIDPVEIAALFTQAVNPVLRLTTLIMFHAIAMHVQQVSPGMAIDRQRLPVGAVKMFPTEAKGIMHGNPQPIRGQTDLLRLLLQGKGGQRKTFQRFAVAPLPGHILLRGNAPGAVQRQFPVAFQQHAHQAVF